MVRLSFYVAVLLAAGVVCASAQNNQPRPSRPDRGMFGNQSGFEQSLVAGGQAGVGWDDGLVGDNQGSASTPLGNVAAPYTQFAGSLQYMLRRQRATINAVGGASVAHYATLDGVNAPSYLSQFGASFQASRRTTVTASQHFTYQPTYSLLRTPEISPDAVFDPESPDPNARDIELPAGSTLGAYLWSESAASASYAVSRRVSVMGGISHSRTYQNSTTADYRSGMLSGGVNWTAAKDLSVHFNYGYGNAHYGHGDTESTYRRQNFDFGVNYQRALSISRRTHAGFWTGSTAVGDRTTVEGSTHFFFVGGANLSREVGRTWGAVLSYNHNVEFTETFMAPVQYDALVGSYGGLINRRTQVNSFIGVSSGVVGFEGPSNRYFTAYAGVTTTIALNKFLGVGASYSYYRSRYDDGIVLPSGYPPSFNRNSVRAQLTMNVPIFQRRGN